MSPRLVQTAIVAIALYLGLSVAASTFAAARDDWSPLVAELRGIRTELTQIRQALQRR